MAVNQYQLVVQAGPDPSMVYELTQPVMHIGRDPSNEIAINDLEISRRHARLTVQPGGYILEDLGSTNGTFVNGQRLVGPHLLRPGEQVALGEKILLSYESVRFDNEATIATPATPTIQRPAPAAGQSYPSAGEVRPVQNYQAAPPAAQPAPAYYSGQLPESPPVYGPVETPKKSSKTTLILGIGCLVVFVCVCAGSAWLFDSLNLYCLPPFNSLFAWLYACP